MGSGLSKGKRNIGAAPAPAPVSDRPTNQCVSSTTTRGGPGNVNNGLLNESEVNGDDRETNSGHPSAGDGVDDDGDGEGDQNRILLENRMDPNRPRKAQAIQQSQGPNLNLNQPNDKPLDGRRGLMSRWLPSWFGRYKKIGRSAIPGVPDSTSELKLSFQPPQQPSLSSSTQVESDDSSEYEDAIMHGSVNEDHPMEIIDLTVERDSAPSAAVSSSSDHRVETAVFQNGREPTPSTICSSVSSSDDDIIDLTVDLGPVPAASAACSSTSSSSSKNSTKITRNDLSFKKTLIGRIDKRKKGLTAFRRDANDPRKQLDYIHATQTFSVGGIIVIYDKKGLICSECDERFEARSTIPTWNEQMYSLDKKITNHVNCKHLDSFQCTVCSRSLSCMYSYQEHMKMHLNDYVCNICGKKTTTEKALKKHELTHMGDAEKKAWMTKMGKRVKPPKEMEEEHECPQCPKKFATAGGLQQHLKLVHGDRKKVRCPKCRKLVLEINYRRYHRVFVCPDKEHWNMKRVQCPLCIDTFKTESIFRNHMRTIHASHRKNELKDDGKYSCSRCRKSFSNRKALAQHKVVHTKKNK